MAVARQCSVPQGSPNKRFPGRPRDRDYRLARELAGLEPYRKPVAYHEVHVGGARGDLSPPDDGVYQAHLVHQSHQRAVCHISQEHAKQATSCHQRRGGSDKVLKLKSGGGK